MTIPPTILHPSLDFLSTDDVQFANDIITELNHIQWAQPLIRKIPKPSEIREYKDFIFELNFGYRLHKCGISPTYEAPGEGKSEIDFSFQHGNYEWLTELMRLAETDASKSATQEHEHITSRILCTPDHESSAEEWKKSLEGEMLKVIERIIGKCVKDNKPHKFRKPKDKIHAILVDMSTYSDGGDGYDKIQIAFTPDDIPSSHRMHLAGRPISGVFDKNNPMRNSHIIRERVHFIIFCSKYKFTPDAQAKLDFAANPHLFQSKEEVRAAFESFPLNPKILI